MFATLAPVRNPPRTPELRFPFNYRFVMRGWNWLFFKPGILMPDQAKSAEWNRGRYLAEGVAHCGSCHTPKNLFGADNAWDVVDEVLRMATSVPAGPNASTTGCSGQA